jgi:hypothetical protein
MAKAQFHRNQKVWVSTVGTWAIIEKIVPIWAKGFGEPVRITYDVGLGREFMADELQAEERVEDPTGGGASGAWRLLRARNKWQEPEDCAHHPFPGSYPVVVTDPQNWGGWRVPGAEYDRDPQLIETQARLIVSAPGLLKVAKDLNAFIADMPEDAPPELQALAKRAGEIVRHVLNAPAAKAEAPARAAAPKKVAAAGGH